MDIDPKLVIDVAVMLVIVGLTAAIQFNKWPPKSSEKFTGNPKDYICGQRYLFFLCIYAFTFLIIVLVLYAVPELLTVEPIKGWIGEIGFAVDEDKKKLTIFALISLFIVRLPKVKSYEEFWRGRLHNWARIPVEVVELKNAISQRDVYFPTFQYRLNTTEEIRKMGLSLGDDFQSMKEHWLQCLENLESEKSLSTVNWRYLRCLSLSLVAKDNCHFRNHDSLDKKLDRLSELGRILAANIPEANLEHIPELEGMSDYFIECVCKNVVKNYPEKEKRFYVFQNLGFKFPHKDYSYVRLRHTVAYCVLIGSFAALLSSVIFFHPIVQNLRAEPIGLVRIGILTGSSFFSFCVAAFIGVWLNFISDTNGKIKTMIGYLTSFTLATFAIATYFFYFPVIDATVSTKPSLVVVISMTFATLSPLIYRAVRFTSHDHKQAILLSISHGIALGFIFISSSFLVLDLIEPWLLSFEISELSKKQLFEASGLLTLLFVQGIVLGGFTTYVIQESKRRQMLAGMRNQPRAPANFFLTVKLDDLNSLKVAAIDLSKNGVGIESRDCHFSPGNSLCLESQRTGEIKGAVKWTLPKMGNRSMSGLYLSSDYQKLHEYLRNNHGAYYA
jgi:hypothetical protein